MSVAVGGQLQCSMNVTTDWTNVPTKYAYQWQSSPDGTTSWVDLPGETRSDILVGSSLAGLYARCGVTASNAAGTTSVVYSAAVGPVTSGLTWVVGTPF